MSPDGNQRSIGSIGLAAAEAEQRLRQFGPNEPADHSDDSFFSDFKHAVSNPLVLILIIAAAVSAFLDEKVDATIIAVIVLLSTAN